jgi:hypothetical protein
MITKRKYENALKVVKEYEQQQKLEVWDLFKSQKLTLDTNLFDIKGISPKLGIALIKYRQWTETTANYHMPTTLSWFVNLSAEEFSRYRGVGKKTLEEYTTLMNAAGIQV